MRTIWLFLCRLVAFPWLALGGYAAWSYIFRFFWEGKYVGVKLSTFANLKLLVSFVGGGKNWKPDSWRALGDAVSSPERVQQIFSGVEPVPLTDLDCDEFAVYQANAIRKSLAEGLMLEDKIQHPRFLTVVWLDGWLMSGHNVVLLENVTSLGTRYSYMDYGMPSELFASIDDVAGAVRARYHKKTSEPVVWCAAEPSLKPWLTQWGSSQ